MLKVESEREDDGRWIAEVPALPGVLGYGATEEGAKDKVKHSRCGSSPTGSITVSPCPARFPPFSQ
jgi:hypothetical protein